MGKGILALAVLAVLVAAAWLLLRTPAAGPGPADAGPLPSAATPPPPSPRPANATGSATAPREGAVAVTGRVVDDRRFPIAGASAALLRVGDAPLSAVSGPDGRFRIEGAVRPGKGEWREEGLRLRAPDGRGAVRAVSLDGDGPAVVDVGVVVVEASIPFSVRVEDSGVAVPGARVLVGRESAWILEARTGEDGVARFEGLPRGPILLFARADGPPRAGHAEIDLGPAAAQPLELPLAPARTVSVFVVVRATGMPVPGATFHARCWWKGPGGDAKGEYGHPLPAAPTDAEGRTRIEGVHPEDFLDLRNPRAPGFDSAGYRPVTIVEPGETEATIEMAGPRAIRFPVKSGGPGEAPVPPDGAEVRLLPDPEPGAVQPEGRGRMEGTTLVVEYANPGDFAARARAPDGSVATLQAAYEDDDASRNPIAFRITRTLEVQARYPDGSPAAGVPLVVLGKSGPPLCPPAPTDASGRVAFAGLDFAWLVSVNLVPDPSSPYGGVPLGIANLRRGDARIEVVVPRRREFLLRVTVDGEARLPGRYFVTIGGYHVRDPVEDPGRGEIRFEAPWNPADPADGIQFGAYPYVGAVVSPRPVPATGPIPCDVALRSPGALAVRVLPPPDGMLRLLLQRWDPDADSWTGAPKDQFAMPREIGMGPGDIARADGLAEGRYRVVDGPTGIATEALEVRPGAEASVASVLDLSKAGWATGRVAGPEGANLPLVRVLVEGPGLVPETGAGMEFGPDPLQRARVDSSGGFRVRVPGDRAVTLRPWHPVLVPAPEGGTAEVTPPCEGIVLRLAAGAQATMRLETDPRVPPWGAGLPRVLLFRGEPRGDPVATHQALLDGDRLTFGAFEPGTWTLVVDLPGEGGTGLAPAILRDVALGEGRTDLGTVRLTGGSRLRVKVLAKEAVDVPRFFVRAERVDPPSYVRIADSSGGREFLLGGLGPGRFRVTANAGTDEGKECRVDRWIEVDGANDLDLPIDLR